MGTYVWNIRLGVFRLGLLTWDILRRILIATSGRLRRPALDLSLAIFCVTSFARDLLLGTLCLKSLAWDPAGCAGRLGIFSFGFAWELSFGIFGLGSFAWGLWLEIFGWRS